MCSKEIKRYGTLLTILFLVSCAACSRENTHSGEILLHDLIASIGRAEIVDSDFAQKYRQLCRYRRAYPDPWCSSPRIVKIGFVIDREKKFQNMKRALYLGAHRHSPCRITIPLDKSELRNCFFSFSLAGLQLRPGGELRIVLADSERRATLFDSREEDPIKERWADFLIDIPDEFTEPRLIISFKTSSERTGHLFLANPRIFKRENELSETPNVVFICIDALRSDAVNAITDRYRLTPHIDSLARDGFAFANHFVVANWTRPSTIAMIASRYASSTGVNLYYPPVHDEEKEFFYRKSGVTPLSTVLKKYGYLTRAIGQDSFIIEYTGIGVDLDFDDLSEYETVRKDTVDITNEVISWIRENRHRKFFLMITYNAPHNAYIPPKRYLNPLKKRLKKIHPWFRAYLGEVSYTDDYLGRVIAELKRLHLYDNSIIIITSDHGEIFHPAHQMSPYTDVKSIFTHGQTQFDEELRAPLVIKPPGSFPEKNVRIEAQVRNIDIAPTILALMEYPVPESYQGKSLLPLIDGSEEEERIVHSEGRKMYSVRYGGYKYAERFYGYGICPAHWGGELVREHHELYDIQSDPHELRNLYTERPDRAEQMKALLRKVRFQQPENIIITLGDGIGGRIRISEGFFYDVRIAGSRSWLKRITRKEYRFGLSEGAKLIYQTIPAYAPVRIQLERRERLLCGRLLLPLAKQQTEREYLIDPAETFCRGEPEEDLISLVQRGIVYWQKPTRSGIRGVKREKYLSADVNRLLRDWGYIQGKEKKEKR